MGYIISYEQIPAGRKKGRSHFLYKWTVYVGIVLFSILGIMSVPFLSQWAQQLLFPSSDGATMEALEALAQDLGRGEPVGEAVYGFCQQVFSQIP